MSYYGIQDSLFLNTSSNIGIGITNPSSKLEVSGSVKSTTYEGTLITAAQANITSVGSLSSLIVSGNIGVGGATSPSLDLTIGDNNTGLNRELEDTLTFYTGGLEHMRIDGLGNISIGKTLAGAPLDVNGLIIANTIQGTLTTSAQANITSVGTLSSLTVGAGTANIEVKGSNSSIYPSLQLTRPSATSYQILNDNGNYELSQYVDGSGIFTDIYTFTGNSHRFFTGGGEKVRINSSGNVGIAVASPTEKLDVLGNIKVSGNSTALQLLLKNGDDWNTYSKPQISLGYNGTDQYSHYIHTRHLNTGTNGNAIDFYTGDTTAAGVFPTNAVHNLTMNGGNIGINELFPTITLAIGDSDTGIDWVSDGIIRFMSNNQEQMSLNPDGHIRITNDLRVDTDTLYVDTTNERVGVNRTPSFPLDVNGTGRFIGEVDSTIDGGGVFTDTYFDKSIVLNRATTEYRNYYLGILGNNTTSTNKFGIAISGGAGADPDPQMSLDSKGRMVLADGLSIGSETETSEVYVVGDIDITGDYLKNGVRTTSFTQSRIDLSGGSGGLNAVVTATYQILYVDYSRTANGNIPPTYTYNQTFDWNAASLLDVNVDSANTSPPVQMGRLQVTIAGYYRINACIVWDSNATGYRMLEMKANGTSVQIDSQSAVNGNRTTNKIDTTRYMSAGQYFELQAYQNSGGNLSFIQSFVEITRLS